MAANKIITEDGKGLTCTDEKGAICIPEITTPSTLANHGKIYFKSDNKLYTLDDLGNEKEVITPGDAYGELYIFNNAVASTISAQNSWHAGQNFTTGSVSSNWTAVTSVNKAITAFADAGGGDVRATAATHTLSVGDYITIVGTTNYDGVYEVKATPTADTFDFTDTWVATDTGVVARGAGLKAGSGSDGLYLKTGNGSMSSAGISKQYDFGIFINTTVLDNLWATILMKAAGEVGNFSGAGFATITEGDVVWAAVRNITDTTAPTIIHASVNIHRI